ncbi:hypothetical protein D3C86_1678860 [compost metagenome]
MNFAGADAAGGQGAELDGGEVGVVQGLVGEEHAVGGGVLGEAVGNVFAGLVFAGDFLLGLGVGGDFDVDEVVGVGVFYTINNVPYLFGNSFFN